MRSEIYFKNYNFKNILSLVLNYERVIKHRIESFDWQIKKNEWKINIADLNLKNDGIHFIIYYFYLRLR